MPWITQHNRHVLFIQRKGRAEDPSCLQDSSGKGGFPGLKTTGGGEHQLPHKTASLSNILFLLLLQVYLKSRLNCLLFANKVEDGDEDSEPVDITSEEETDDLWKNMETVGGDSDRKSDNVKKRTPKRIPRDLTETSSGLKKKKKRKSVVLRNVFYEDPEVEVESDSELAREQPVIKKKSMSSIDVFRESTCMCQRRLLTGAKIPENPTDTSHSQFQSRSSSLSRKQRRALAIIETVRAECNLGGGASVGESEPQGQA